jgi:hypothetical protein
MRDSFTQPVGWVEKVGAFNCLNVLSKLGGNASLIEKREWYSKHFKDKTLILWTNSIMPFFFTL